ncbi:MAG TPA: cytochrome c family protein [Devosiaceae bacterium]|jgi:cytochrome c
MKVLALGAVFVALSAGAAFAAGDATAGATVFKKCAVCHSIGDGAVNKIGPILTGVVGRVAGTEAGFNYSPAMVDAGKGGLTWTEADLSEFLHKPSDKVKGTKMTFPGLPNQTDIDNVVAYLASMPAK